ncbi:MAG TPA: hypothetical protein VJC00_03730 [Candidatus Nanoarchaeia archaeon]|nr:hypothetical protein [Candidatus Nanoarchaeia archaeon]
MKERYNVQTENSVYVAEKREDRWYIQKVWPKTDDREFMVMTFTTDRRVYDDVKKDLKTALKNAGSYRYASPLEPGAFILHSGGCTTPIRSSKKVEEIRLAA